MKFAELLTAEQVQRVHDASLWVLENVGSEADTVAEKLTCPRERHDAGAVRQSWPSRRLTETVELTRLVCHADVSCGCAERLTGQLQLHAARVERVEGEGKRVRVHLSGGETLTGDLVINATGPQTRFSDTSSVLLKNLLQRGLVAPDDMEMGIRVDDDHTVIDRDGQRSKILLALGPLLRGTLWETIAVPELRGQARRVAETLLDQPPLSDTMPPEVVMEYMI